MVGWIIAGVTLPTCVVAAWFIIRKPLRHVVEEMGADQARLVFHQRREWLEAGFLTSLAKLDPVERLRWESAHWHNEVFWARDNQTRRLLALVEIDFEHDAPGSASPLLADHATALFEYRRGQWFADGKRIDATRPGEALSRHNHFEPLSPPHRRV